MLIIPVRDLAAGQASLDLDWQYASPTGGFVTSDFWPARNVERGHVIRVKGVWSVVQDIVEMAGGRDREPLARHFVTYAGCVCSYAPADGVNVRTDYRVAREADIGRARSAAARWIAETEGEQVEPGGPWSPSDANLAQVFADVVKPIRHELYGLVREQLADRSWLEVSA